MITFIACIYNTLKVNRNASIICPPKSVSNGSSLGNAEVIQLAHSCGILDCRCIAVAHFGPSSETSLTELTNQALGITRKQMSNLFPTYLTELCPRGITRKQISIFFDRVMPKGHNSKANFNEKKNLLTELSPSEKGA